jgi:tyrosine-protein kinase Etk/Wzc
LNINNATQPDSIPPPTDGTVDLLELAATFFAEWRVGAITFLGVFLLGALLTYVTKPQFEATALLLPQAPAAQSTSLSAIFSVRTPGDVYLGLLASRTTADKVIDRVHLMEVFRTQSRSSARNSLANSSKFTVRKDTLVSIEIRNSDSVTAASIANAYIDALQEQQEAMAMDLATARSRVFERQVDQEKSALAAAELELKKSEQSSGLLQPESQTQMSLSANASIRAQITTMQVQLAGMLQSSTDENPQVKTIRSQIARLEAEQRNMESGSGGGMGSLIPGGKMPEVNLEFARKFREVKYHEALLAALGNQFESARLSEVQTVSQFQVVDRAIIPERKSWPPRALFLALSLIFGVLLGSIVMILTIVVHRLKADPVQSKHLAAIRRSFRRVR